MFTAFVESVSKKLQENLPIITRILKEHGLQLPPDKLGSDTAVRPVFEKGYALISKYLPPPHNLITFIVDEEDFVRYCLDNRAHIADLMQQDISKLAELEKNLKVTPRRLTPEQEEANLRWNIQFLRILSFIELSRVDSEISPEEVDYIERCIENSGLDEKTQHDLRDHIRSNTKPNIDFGHFHKNSYEAISLMLDLVALARCNGRLHIAEKIYIKKVGRELGISEADINELMEQ
jgi:hypothetical protein